MTTRIEPLYCDRAGGLTLGQNTGVICFRFSMGCVMDPRYFLSALAGVFVVVLIFATVTTFRHLSTKSDAVIARPG